MNNGSRQIRPAPGRTRPVHVGLRERQPHATRRDADAHRTFRASDAMVPHCARARSVPRVPSRSPVARPQQHRQARDEKDRRTLVRASRGCWCGRRKSRAPAPCFSMSPRLSRASAYRRNCGRGQAHQEARVSAPGRDSALPTTFSWRPRLARAVARESQYAHERGLESDRAPRATGPATRNSTYQAHRVAPRLTGSPCREFAVS